jgi:hypothetical protein
MNKLVAVVVLALCSPSFASKQDGPRAFAGRYQYVGGVAETDALSAAVETVVQKMNFLFRGIARKRLKRSNQPSSELTLLLSDAAITVVRPGQPTVAAPANGRPVTVRLDGDAFEVTHGFDGSRLYQTFKGPKSFSRNDLVLSPDGLTLTVFTRIESRHLPIPVLFHLTYRRAAAGL